MNEANHTYPRQIRLVHMGLAIFGIAAYLTAEGAEDSNAGLAYLLHACLGMTLSVFILLRILPVLEKRPGHTVRIQKALFDSISLIRLSLLNFLRPKLPMMSLKVCL